MEPFDKHVDLLTVEQLRNEYLAEEEAVRISLYMPTHRKGAEIQQDPIRLKHLIQKAHEKLVAHGMRSSEAWDFLAPPQRLLEDTFFWSNQCDGLALFISPETMSVFRLPEAFEECAHVGKRFHVKPLVPLFSEDGRFYVLALSQGGVRLLQGSRFTIGEVDLRETPTNIEEILSQFDFERTLQMHTGKAPVARAREKQTMMFHGQGSGADETNMKERLTLFMHRLDVGLRKTLGPETAPMILAGVEFIRGYYRDSNHYPNLLDIGIDGNPDRLKAEEIHHKAWEILGPLFSERTETALRRYQDLSGISNGRKTTHDLKQAVQDAYFKRIETLFVPRKGQCWGKFDPDSLEVTINGHEENGYEDLYDFAVFHTLKNKGTVYSIDQEAIPEGSDIAAIYW